MRPPIRDEFTILTSNALTTYDLQSLYSASNLAELQLRVHAWLPRRALADTDVRAGQLEDVAF